MSSQSERRSDNLSKDNVQATPSATIDVHRLTFEEREDEREIISHAHPGGFERILNEQRLPAEGIGAPDGELRHVFDHYTEPEPADVRTSSTEYGGESEAPVVERRDEIRC